MQLQKKNILNRPSSKPKLSEYKVNEAIDTSVLRLVGHEGEQLGIVSRSEAFSKARFLGLDLVEISSLSKPPVCKLMNYGKFRYEQKRKTLKAKKKHSSPVVKEIKFRPKTDTHDFDVKVKSIRKFLMQQKKVKVSVVFRGREIIHVDIGKQMLQKVITEAKSFSLLDSAPKMEGKQLVIILSPIR